MSDRPLEYYSLPYLWKRIEALEARLEVGVGGVDGIAARDETIKLLDQRIEELEAERDDILQWELGRIYMEKKVLQAKLKRVERLPDKWRPTGIGYLGEYENALVKCANELEAALQGQKDA